MAQEQLAMKRGVRSHFNNIASFYEAKKKSFYLDLMKSQVQKYHGRSVIDLGCASGLALSWVHADVKVGLDFAIDFIKAGHSGISYLVADVEHVPFRDATFESALCLDVLEHLPSFKVVDEAYRLLTKNGVLLLAVARSKYEWLLDLLEKLNLKLPEGPHRWLSDELVESALRSAGFNFGKSQKMHMNFYACIK
ncbi:MAG: class I SAM-dependent methyltransferase [Candidatus Bathyarchaeia archaeon]